MIEVLTVLIVLGIYFCGILGFPFAVRHIRPIDIFVRDISSGGSYKNYKDCITIMSVFWIIILIAVGVQHLWEWISNMSLKNSGYNPPPIGGRPGNLIIPEEPPYQLLGPNYPLRSGQGWTVGDYRTALNSLRKQLEDTMVRVEVLEGRLNDI